MMSRHRRMSAFVGRLGASLLALMALFTLLSCAPSQEARIDEVLRRARLAPETIVPLTAPYLTDPDPDVRALAVWAIGQRGIPGAASALAPLVADPDEQVRVSTAAALCRVEEADAATPLIALAGDSAPAVRRLAVECLAKLDPFVEGVMPRALEDLDRTVRAIALAALARRPEPEALEKLGRIVKTGAVDEQLAAVEAIRRLANPAAIPDLEAAASSRLPATVRDAVEAAIVELRAAAADASVSDPGSGT
jgi:HEAT repeat protein